MILELVLTPVFALIEGIIMLFPADMSLPGWMQDTANLLGYALMFFPPDVWLVVIGNIAGWHIWHITWALIEWTYKKLPGVS